MVREKIKSNSKVLKGRRERSFVKTLWIFFGLVILLIALAFVSRLKYFEINKIEVSGNKILLSENLEEKTKNILSNNVGFIFAGDNKFLFSKKRIKSELKKNFPRILSVSVERIDKSLSVNVTERQRAFLWCGENPPKYEEDFKEKDCFFVDEVGFIFDKAPSFSDGIYFTFYSGINEGNPIGQNLLGFDSLKKIVLLVNAMEEKSLPTHSLVILPDGQYKLLFSINSTNGAFPKLFFTSEQSVDEVYNKVISFIDQDPFKTDFLEKKEKLEYIDARFKNRIFYKFAE